MTLSLFNQAPAFDRLACMDALAWLGTIPDQSVDLVVTDPAYESLEKHRKVGTTTRLKKSAASSNEWFPIFPNVRFLSLFVELYRVLKANTHCYVLCDEETMWVIRPIAESVGFRYWKSLIWDKGTIGMGYHWRNRTERIVFLEKGKRRLNDLGLGDVLEAPALLEPDAIIEPWSDDIIKVPRVRAGYPTEKPYDLLLPLVRNSSSEGEVVLDPFMGSGSTGFAAEFEGRIFAGCDIEPKAVALTKRRLLGDSDVRTVRQGFFK